MLACIAPVSLCLPSCAWGEKPDSCLSSRPWNSLSARHPTTALNTKRTSGWKDSLLSGWSKQVLRRTIICGSSFVGACWGFQWRWPARARSRPWYQPEWPHQWPQPGPGRWRCWAPSRSTRWSACGCVGSWWSLQPARSHPRPFSPGGPPLEPSQWEPGFSGKGPRWSPRTAAAWSQSGRGPRPCRSLRSRGGSGGAAAPWWPRWAGRSGWSWRSPRLASDGGCPHWGWAARRTPGEPAPWRSAVIAGWSPDPPACYFLPEYMTFLAPTHTGITFLIRCHTCHGSGEEHASLFVEQRNIQCSASEIHHQHIKNIDLVEPVSHGCSRGLVDNSQDLQTCRGMETLVVPGNECCWSHHMVHRSPQTNRYKKLKNWPASWAALMVAFRWRSSKSAGTDMTALSMSTPSCRSAIFFIFSNSLEPMNSGLTLKVWLVETRNSALPLLSITWGGAATGNRNIETHRWKSFH